MDYSINPDSIQIARGCHAYYLLKIADLLDTVFFVLRKKDNQVSFLHMYHHTGMVVLTWTATKFLPGGHSIFTGFINSIIHIVMYAYYLITAFSPKYKNNVWWKKYITQMQIVSRTQFNFEFKKKNIKRETLPYNGMLYSKVYKCRFWLV